MPKLRCDSIKEAIVIEAWNFAGDVLSSSVMEAQVCLTVARKSQISEHPKQHPSHFVEHHTLLKHPFFVVDIAWPDMQPSGPSSALGLPIWDLFFPPPLLWHTNCLGHWVTVCGIHIFFIKLGSSIFWEIEQLFCGNICGRWIVWSSSLIFMPYKVLIFSAQDTQLFLWWSCPLLFPTLGPFPTNSA